MMKPECSAWGIVCVDNVDSSQVPVMMPCATGRNALNGFRA